MNRFLVLVTGVVIFLALIAKVIKEGISAEAGLIFALAVITIVLLWIKQRD